MPPLRRTPDDIPLLVEYFIDAFNTRVQKARARCDAGRLRRAAGYGWPGNVRELRNVIERAMLLSDADRLDAQRLPGNDQRRATPATNSSCRRRASTSSSSNEASWCRRCDGAATTRRRRVSCSG